MRSADVYPLICINILQQGKYFSWRLFSILGGSKSTSCFFCRGCWLQCKILFNGILKAQFVLHISRTLKAKIKHWGFFFPTQETTPEKSGPEPWELHEEVNVFWTRHAQSSRCCPVVQHLLETEAGLDASIHVGWMGTVGCEKEASIHGFIEELHYQHGSLCIRITERLLVSQVGYGKEHQEFGFFTCHMQKQECLEKNVVNRSLK